MHYLRCLFQLFAIAVIAPACAPRQEPLVMDEPPAALDAAAAAHYDQYGAALSAARRGAIAAFYHQDGALVVLNGVARRHTQEELNRKYRNDWRPPTHFAWEDLAFDSISPSQVLVTGGFQWQASGQQDTSRYIYAALLVAADSGMAIVFEHETERPVP